MCTLVSEGTDIKYSTMITCTAGKPKERDLPQVLPQLHLKSHSARSKTARGTSNSIFAQPKWICVPNLLHYARAHNHTIITCNMISGLLLIFLFLISCAMIIAFQANVT